MNPTHLTQSGLLDLVSQSGIVAKLVLFALFLASIFCWSIIFSKWRIFRTALKQNKRFKEVFWSGKSVDEIMGKSDRFAASPVASVFKAGIKELRKASNEHSNPEEKAENLYRSLLRASNDELSSLERNLGWLATTASAAPFVGLFGTVWGIMNSFQNIGATGNANLAIVAPGISEALITTAAGIAAAIPAVIAYNHFLGQVRRVATDMENFSQDFVAIAQKSSRKG